MDALTENLTHRLDIEVWLKKILILEAKFCFLLSPNYIFDSPPNDCYCFLIKLIPLSHKITAEIIIFIASIAAAFIETKQRFNIEQVGVKLGQDSLQSASNHYQHISSKPNQVEYLSMSLPQLSHTLPMWF